METTIIRHSTEETSWLKIKEAVNCNGADSFNLGDKVATTLKNGQRVEFTVVAINPYSDNELALVMEDLLDDEYRLNEKWTNAGGWEKCDFRKKLNTEIYDLLPDELKAVIKPRKIVQVINGVRHECIDNLWLPSYVELFGRENDVDVEDVHFPVFNTYKSRVKNRKGCWEWYWLRSPLASSSTHFCIVTSHGGANTSTAYGSNGVAFGFLI